VVSLTRVLVKKNKNKNKKTHRYRHRKVVTRGRGWEVAQIGERGEKAKSPVGK